MTGHPAGMALPGLRHASTGLGGERAISPLPFFVSPFSHLAPFARKCVPLPAVRNAPVIRLL
ncbi:hypothetical protein HNO88_000685 [Novosphingobium chloroacetimidivorans]|uniref:Uncharacterized protein n=1 Tax=Novosphingobium chloroacetimidivorans TaxID=1428314 RepID=A0A7W7NUC2_9SPHN|nr:hypothetical protein [Novosphingobium chloroacetimidivorans]